jgi:hypothetical protein
MLVTAAVCVTLIASLPAWAGLGGDVTSIQADQVHMQGTRRTIAAESYTVHEIQAASGTVVREYVSFDGKVFAVAFHGRWQPDMRQLLGSHFDQYYQAVQARSVSDRRARRPVMIEQPGLTVQIGGHLGNFAGRAYVPEMLPPGVRSEDIQ